MTENYLTSLVARINGYYTQDNEDFITVREVKLALPEDLDESAEKVKENRILKTTMTLVSKKLQHDVSLNQKFNDTTGNQLLDNFLKKVRLKELLNARIVKKGGSSKTSRSRVRYDISEFANSYYGSRILRKLEFGKRRRIVSEEELDTIKKECLKIKLKLPQIVEPTITEKFFTDRPDKKLLVEE